VLAAQPRAGDIVHEGATDMGVAVGGDGDADAGSTDQNAASGSTGLWAKSG
jgi:hypothetical protein